MGCLQATRPRKNASRTTRASPPNCLAGGERSRERYQAKIARSVQTRPAYEAYDKAQKVLADGDSKQAKQLVQKAIAIEPREGHFHSLLGDIEQGGERYGAARRHYSDAISLNDDFFYYYLQRGLVQQKLNEVAAARRVVERSVKLLPTANAYSALGNIAKSEKQYDLAKRYYAEAAGSESAAGQAAFGSLV